MKLSRVLAVFLSLILSFTLFSDAFAVVSSAVAGIPERRTVVKKTVDTSDRAVINGLQYEIIDDYISITGYTDDVAADLVIPETIENLPVKSIGFAAFFDCQIITSVSMPSVTELLMDAFSSCQSLTTVDMPRVITIGDTAFDYCSKLTSVDMPYAETVGYSSFSGCAFSSIAMPSVTTLGEYAFNYCINLVNVSMPSVTTIGSFAFNNCSKIESITIPACTTDIGMNPFVGCKSLTLMSVDYANGYYYSVSSALYNKSMTTLISCFGSLFQYTVPVGVTTISDYAFAYMDTLDDVTMQDATSIGRYAFYNCTGLNFASMPNADSIGESAFDGCSTLVLATMPSVTTIESFAFNNCSSLMSATTPLLKTIYLCAFYGCKRLSDVDLSNTETIDSSAFEGCVSLNSIDMPKVTSIGDNAFSLCTFLSSVNMPVVTEIGDTAFSYCKRLTTVTIPACTETLGESVFEGCDRLVDIIVADNNANYASEGGILLTKDKSALICYPSAQGSVVLSNSITTINLSAFHNCDQLVSIDMPGVTMVDEWAFDGCDSLVSVKMSSITNINPYAFYGCNKLSSAIFTSAAPADIDDTVFCECAEDFAIYFTNGANGWTTPSWCDYPTVSFDNTAEYTVTFVDDFTNDVYDTATYAAGTVLTSIPPIEHDGYMCTGWDYNNLPLLSNITITVSFIPAYELTYEIVDLCAHVTGFTGTLPENLIVPETFNDYPVTQISGFANSTGLVSVTMPSITYVNYQAFKNCTALETVSMTAVKDISYESFSGCTSLISVSMTPVETVYARAFYSCISLESAYIPVATVIYNDAFFSCISLKSVTIQSVVSIGSMAFAECSSLARVGIPYCTNEIGANPFLSCTSLTVITVNANNKFFSAENGMLFDKDKTSLLSYPTASGNITLPNSVTSIGAYALSSCANITAIDIPAVTSLGEGTFMHCLMLTSVNIPAVERIPEMAFMLCINIESIHLNNVSSIGARAFMGCYSLSAAYFYSDAPEEFGIFMSDVNPETVFADCAQDFSIYYLYTANGWTTPTWNGYPAQPFAPEDIEFTVAFIDWDGTVLDTQTVQYGEAATAPEEPTRIGYSFDGWDRAFDNIVDDTIVTATYTINSYDILYYVDNELYETETYDFGEAVTPIDEPTRTGYTFSGWSDIPETMPAEDVRIDGSFIIDTYTVTFVDGLTDDTISTVTVNHGDNAVFPDAPIHDGYTFTGWDSDGTNITADITITALYEIITYTVTFVDGLTNDTISTVTVNHGDDVVFPDAPIHDGYTFNGWDSDGTNITADITITALYEENILIGDANGDGKINTGDATTVLRYAVDLIEFDAPQLLRADMNGDGKVNTGDAVSILMYCVNL